MDYESPHTTGTATLDEVILDQAIDTQMKGSDQKVEDFTANVQKGVQDRTKELTDKYGESVRYVSDKAMENAKSYRQSRDEILPGFEAKDLTKHKADGLYEEQGNVVSVERKKYMERGKTGEAEKQILEDGTKVGDHELAHRDDQAKSTEYDLEEIVIDPTAGKDGTAEVLDMREGNSIRAGKQTDAELPPSYIRHREQHDAVVQAAGGNEAFVKEAIKTGQLLKVQEQIVERNRDRFAKTMNPDVNAGTARPAAATMPRAESPR